MAGLGELILRVGANITEFTTGMNKVEYQLSKLATQFDKVGGNVAKSLTTNLLGVASAIVGIGAATAAVTGAFKLANDLERMADTVGSTIEELDKFHIITKLNDASLEDLEKTFKNVNKSMVESLDGSSKAGKVFEALGVSVTKVDGSFRSTGDVMKDTIVALSKIDDQAIRTAVGTEILGKSYNALAPTIKNFANDSKIAEEVMKRFGSVSTDTAKQIAQLDDELTAMAEGSKRALINNLVPAVEVARAAIAVYLDEYDKMSKPDRAQWGEILVTVLGTIADSFRLVITLVKAFVQSMQVVAADIAVINALPLRFGAGATEETKAQFAKVLADRNKILEDANKTYDELWNGSGTAIEDNLRKQYQLIKAGNEAVRQLPQNSDQNDRKVVSINTGEIAAQTEKAKKLMDSLRPAVKATKDELLDFAEKMRTANFADSIGLDEKTVESYNKLSEAVLAGKLAADQFTPAVERLLDADSKLKKEQDELNKALDAMVDVQRKGTQAAADHLSKMLDQAGAVGKTGDALIDYNTYLAKTAALEGQTNQAVIEGIETYYNMANALEKSTEARKKSFDAYTKGLQAGKDLVSSLQAEIGAYGLTTDQLAIYNVELARKAALLDVTDAAQIAAINKEYDYAAALAATGERMKKNVEDTKALATEFGQLGDAAVDWTGRFIEDSEKAFKDAGAAFKKYLLRVILESTVKPFVISFLASVTGNAQAGNLANQANNPLGAIGNVFGVGGASGGGGATGGFDFTKLLGSGITDAFSGVATSIGSTISASLFSTIGGAGTAQAAALAAQTAAFGAEGTALTLGALGTAGAGAAASLLAVIPVVGAFAAAAYLAYTLLAQKKGGPKVGGFASIGDTTGITGTDSTGRYFTPNNTDAEIQKTVNGISDAYKEALTALGGSGAAAFALGFDTDPKGTAPNRLHAGVFVNGQQVYDKAESDLGRDDETLQAALALESQRVILAALQASELPERIATIIDSIDAGTASAADIDKVIKLGAGVQKLSEIIKDLPTGIQDKLLDSFDGTDEMFAELQDIAKAFASISLQVENLPEGVGERLLSTFDGTKESVAEIVKIIGAFDAMRQIMDSGTPLEVALSNIAGEAANAAWIFDNWTNVTGDLITSFDGSTDAALNLAAATQYFYASAVALVQQIEVVKASLDTMFGDTIRSLTLQTLSPDEKYDFLQDETEALRGLISTSVDPEEIQELAQRINQNIQDAFNLLSPDEQKEQLGQFIENVDEFNDEVNARLNAIETDVQTTVADVLTEVQGALDSVADKMVSAADAQVDAANAQLVAANTPVVVRVVTTPQARRGDVNS